MPEPTRRGHDTRATLTLTRQDHELRDSLIACRLTCSFAPCLERGFPLRRFSHVIAGCGPSVLRSWRASGAGLAGVWCTGGLGRLSAGGSEFPAEKPGG